MYFGHWDLLVSDRWGIGEGAGVRCRRGLDESSATEGQAYNILIFTTCNEYRNHLNQTDDNDKMIQRTDAGEPDRDSIIAPFTTLLKPTGVRTLVLNGGPHVGSGSFTPSVSGRQAPCIVHTRANPDPCTYPYLYVSSLPWLAWYSDDIILTHHCKNPEHPWPE